MPNKNKEIKWEESRANFLTEIRNNSTFSQHIEEGTRVIPTSRVPEILFESGLSTILKEQEEKHKKKIKEIGDYIKGLDSLPWDDQVDDELKKYN